MSIDVARLSGVRLPPPPFYNMTCLIFAHRAYLQTHQLITLLKRYDSKNFYHLGNWYVMIGQEQVL